MQKLKNMPKPANLDVMKKSSKPAAKAAKPAAIVLERSKATYHAEIMDSFPQYNLSAERIIRNGTPANTQLIVKDEKVVHAFTERYKVLPNEEALKVAEMIREECGLVYASDMKKEWNFHTAIPKMLGNVNRAITTLLIDPKEVNLAAGTKYEDDYIRLGIGIGNSIDGTSSLKAFGFTFRKLCGNYAFHLFHLGKTKIEADINPAAMNSAKVLNKSIFIHSKNIDIKTFEESVRNVLGQGQLIVKRYQAMKIEELLEKQALELARRMPTSALKKAEDLKWLKWDKKKGAQFVKTAKVDKFQAFNDITAALTHNEDLSYRVKMNGFKRLDKILVAPSAK
ncbi:hypothetical protein KAR91_03535 [Candidatus Pacearchaeota archaeon]|nr:hypothetical protein [Candidatus Pacearchaeota archaeon]